VSEVDGKKVSGNTELTRRPGHGSTLSTSLKTGPPTTSCFKRNFFTLIKYHPLHPKTWNSVAATRREIGAAAISRGELSMDLVFRYALTMICHTLCYILDTRCDIRYPRFDAYYTQKRQKNKQNLLSPALSVSRRDSRS